MIGKTDPEMIATLTVYCDAHASLVKMISNYGISASHSPPGRPQANAEIERKIGVAINGIRAYLAQAGCHIAAAHERVASSLLRARRLRQRARGVG